MATSERKCWVSSERTNNDHVFHTSVACRHIKNIKPENLKQITFGQARKRRMPRCSDC